MSTLRSLDVRYKAGAKDDLHDKLLKACIERITLSENSMSSNYDKWRDLEKRFLMHRPTNSKDAKAKAKTGMGEDEYKSIDVSFSYALLMTAHAYYVNTFVNKPLMFPIEGLNGEGAMKESAVESLLQYQVRVGKFTPNIMVWLLDSARYGVGFLGDYWTEEYKTKAEVVTEEEKIDGIETGKSVTRINRQKTSGYKGNKLFNILPFDALPDPRVPLINLQQGEFFGRKVKISWNEFVTRAENGEYINKEAARGLLGTGKSKGDQNRFSHKNAEILGEDVTKTPDDRNKVGMLDAIELVVDVIPSEWGLSKSVNLPEKWVFTIVDKTLLIGVRPLGRLDDMFPFHVLEQEIDGYFQKSRGLLELTAEMNDVLSWLFNSHMYNKEQSIYNQFIYDPSLVVEKDLTRRAAGKLVRLKPTAYGRDVRSVVSQLPVNDVTQSNYADTGVVEKMMQRTVGINDDVAGSSSASSRRSATEFRGTTSFSADRLATTVTYFSATGFNSLARSLISTSLSNYTDEVKVKIAGDTIPTVTDQQGAIRVDGDAFIMSPEDLVGEYDIMPLDGTKEIDRGMESQLYMQFMQTAMSIPGFAEQYRIPDLFAFIGKKWGLKGLDRFKFNVLSDDVLLSLVEQERLNGNQNQTTGAAATGAGSAEEPMAAVNGASGVPTVNPGGGGFTS